MLRACTLAFTSLWEDHLHLISFAYNNSYNASIKITLLEVLFVRKFRLLFYWTTSKKESYLDLRCLYISRIVKFNNIKGNSRPKKKLADIRCRVLQLQVGESVFLKISPMIFILISVKLSLIFIGLF